MRTSRISRMIAVEAICLADRMRIYGQAWHDHDLARRSCTGDRRLGSRFLCPCLVDARRMLHAPRRLPDFTMSQSGIANLLCPAERSGRGDTD